MKSRKDLTKKYSAKELADSFVFPGSKNAHDVQERLELFRGYRRKAKAKMTVKARLMSHLLQLRFQIEDYLQSDHFSESHTFAFFLKEYIARLNKRNNEFADEIDMDPSELSQIINQHGAPNQKLIIRLEIHSNKNFPALLWFKLIEKEKAHALVHNEDLRNEERKHVKQKLAFSLVN